MVVIHPDSDARAATNRRTKRRRAGMDTDGRMAEAKSEGVRITAKA